MEWKPLILILLILILLKKLYDFLHHPIGPPLNLVDFIIIFLFLNFLTMILIDELNIPSLMKSLLKKIKKHDKKSKQIIGKTGTQIPKIPRE